MRDQDGQASFPNLSFPLVFLLGGPTARLHHHLHSGFVRRGHSHGLGLDLTDRNGNKQLEIIQLTLSDYNFKDTYHDPFEIDCRAVC